MVGIPSRHKSLALLAAVLIAQLLLLAVQIKRDSKGRLIRVWAVSAVSPFERSGAWGFGKVGGLWHHYFALQNTARENEALRVENDALKMAISELQSKSAEAERLSTLLNFRDAHSKVPMLMARVIGAGAGNASRIVEIDRGERDGVRRNLGVITPDGAVGKVIEVYRDTAQVLLLTDKDGGVGAMFVDSHDQKPVGGTGEARLTVKYVPNDDKISVGQKVVTSGMDKIFPQGIPVGTVQEVKAGKTFKDIWLTPAAKLERLEEVIVLLTQEPVEYSKESESQSPPVAATPANGSAPATNEQKP